MPIITSPNPNPSILKSHQFASSSLVVAALAVAGVSFAAGAAHAAPAAPLDRLSVSVGAFYAEPQIQLGANTDYGRIDTGDEKGSSVTLPRAKIDLLIGENRENGKNRALRRFVRPYCPQIIRLGRLANDVSPCCIVVIYDRGRSLLGNINDVELTADGSSRGRQGRSDNLSARRLWPQRVKTHPHRAGERALHRSRFRVLQAPIRLRRHRGGAPLWIKRWSASYRRRASGANR